MSQVRFRAFSRYLNTKFRFSDYPGVLYRNVGLGYYFLAYLDGRSAVDSWYLLSATLTTVSEARFIFFHIMAVLTTDIGFTGWPWRRLPVRAENESSSHRADPIRPCHHRSDLFECIQVASCRSFLTVNLLLAFGTA